MKILEYDVSHLEHPRPLEIMSEALLYAHSGDILLMKHYREPLLLYDVIKAQALTYVVNPLDSKLDSKTNPQPLYRIYIAKESILKPFVAYLQAHTANAMQESAQNTTQNITNTAHKGAHNPTRQDFQIFKDMPCIKVSL